jgi:hypothetical protein
MKSGNDTLTVRDQKVLDHVGRYRLTFKEVIRRVYFDGSDPQKVLDRLRKSDLLATCNGFGGNRKAYGLTAAGAAACGLGVPAAKAAATALGSQSMPEYLSILAFCFFLKTPRALLLPGEIQELLGTRPAGRFHCVENTNTPCVYHVYVPGPTTKARDIVSKTQSHLREVTQSPQVAPWVEAGLYRHAILVDSQRRVDVINRSVEGAMKETDLHAFAPTAICVFQIPSPEKLEEALGEL